MYFVLFELTCQTPYKKYKTVRICMLVCFLSLRHIFFLFWLLPLGVTTAGNLPPSHDIPRLCFCYPNRFHVLLHYIHEPSLWSSFPPTWSSIVIILSTLPLLLYLQTAQPQLPLSYTFKILSILVNHQSHLFNSATSSFTSCL